MNLEVYAKDDTLADGLVRFRCGRLGNLRMAMMFLVAAIIGKRVQCGIGPGPIIRHGQLP